MKHTRIWATLLAAGLISACGGGGGGDSPPAAAPTSSVRLSGVVAKGKLLNAAVKAHPIKADGSVDLVTVLAETTSDAVNGTYTLNFTATVNQPYVIRVSPKPAGQVPATTQVDEISGTTSVAADFSMRALFVPATSGTVTTSASVTPFSELAVAAAASGTNGITATNAAQAIVNVTTLLGFNPTEVTPTTIAGAGTNAQQLAFATMLTAVSKLANESGLGCTEATLAERTECVVSTMAAASTLSSTKPGTVVSAALTTAAQAVITDNNLPPTTVAVVTANLQGAGTPPAVPTSDTQTAIAAAKLLFTNLRSDWATLFGGTAPTAKAEAEKFRTAMRDVQTPAELLIKDSGALLMGIDLYRDYMAGRTNISNRGRGPAVDFVANSTTFNSGSRTSVGCRLYTDTTNTVEATSTSQVNSIGCEALYYITRVNQVGSADIVRWRHGFAITPTSPTNFSYTTRARRTTDNCINGVCTQTANVALQTDFYSGTVVVTPDANGHVVGFTIAGGLPGAFADGGNTLVNERHTWNLTGTRTLNAVQGDSTATVTGSISAFATGGTTPIGTLTVTSATLAEVPVSRDANDEIVRRGSSTAVADAGGEVATANLNLTWATPTASFTGTLAMTNSVWDASQQWHAPTSISLTGSLRNIEGSTTTEFLTGSLTATITGYAQFNENLPVSATNNFTGSFQFSGTVTAPSRPTLAITLATSMRNDADQPSTLTGQYRTLVNGTATQTVNVTGTQPATGPATLSLSEAASNVSLHWTDGAGTVSLRRGSASNGTEIGTLNTHTYLLTYVDGSTNSLYGF